MSYQKERAREKRIHLFAWLAWIIFFTIAFILLLINHAHQR